MGFLTNYKKANSNMSEFPIVKLSEMNGRVFHIHDYHIKRSLKSDFGDPTDAAILEISFDGEGEEHYTLFIRQKWIFAFFEEAYNISYTFIPEDSYILEKKKNAKGQEYWDLSEYGVEE